MPTTSFIITLISSILIIDFYFYRSVKKFVQQWSQMLKNSVRVIYWAFTLSVISFLFFIFTSISDNTILPKFIRTYVFGFIFITVVSKLIGVVFILLDDLISLFLFLKKQVVKILKVKEPTESAGRKAFLKKAAIIASAIPFTTLMFGVLKSAFDFTVRKQTLNIKGLPGAFKGLKIVQISDIHIGSFISEEPIKKAVQMINEQQADLIFFTGDLVNEITEEALPFIDILKQISAPLGVFSILGNHDYGDYFYSKDDVRGKTHNYQLMQKVHQQLGWKLLRNESHILKKDNERLAILGVENWGSLGRFPKYGDIEKAKKGCLEKDVKVLLSHDPSHWEEKVLHHHADIAVTFSGHTHGMQFGIEIPGFKWSPSKYVYKFWAGLYRKGQQQIYVNRGLGFVGYPGRVGILPEITVFELS